MHAPWFLNSTSRDPHLRIGVLLDGPTLPAHLAETLEHIANSNFARVELVVFNAATSRIAKKNTGLFARYVAWDVKRISEALNPLAEIDCARYLKDVETLSVTPIVDQDSQRFSNDAVARIREKNLDVLVKFGFGELRGEILNAARYSVWTYHHGDPDRYRGGPPYFWEVYEDNLLTCTALERLADEPSENQILCRGVFATIQGSSWARNRVQPYWGSTTFLIQKLHQLHESGWDSVAGDIPQPVHNTKTYSTPTDLEMLPWLSKILVRTGAQRVRHSIVGEELPHWMLGVKTNSSSSAKLNLREFRWIQSPRGHFYADPFVIEHDGKPWVFFEDLPYSTDKGIIVCAEINRDGSLSPTIPVLELPYHLSYPCIFRDAGELYMVPESVADGTVQLYRCERFPDVWKQVKVLLRAPAVDPTVWIENGLYWFFVTLQEPRGGGLQLWLFYSRSLTGDLIRSSAKSHLHRHPLQSRCRRDIPREWQADSPVAGLQRQLRASHDLQRNYSFERTRIRRASRALIIDTHDMPKMIGTHSYGRVGNVVVIDGCVPTPAKQVR